MDSLSRGNRNFRSSGNSLYRPERVPRHSAGISRQAAPSDFPANGLVATFESNAVSQASPSGSLRFVLSGKSGARDRAPQGRGLKIGSMRVRTGATTHQKAA